MEKWFKFYSADYLLDGKIRSLTGEERSCWITLLCLADTSDIPGEIKYLNDNDLITLSGCNDNAGILAKFEQLEMIKRNDNGMITILNFRKRQGKALSNYERLKKYRESQKEDDNDLKRMITHDNADDNTRIEENRIEENNKKGLELLNSFKDKYIKEKKI